MSQARNWRYCRKCHGLFYDGDKDKGRCAIAHPHEAEKGSPEFVLPCDMPANGAAQAAWRYCKKCRALFYDGFNAKTFIGKGKCPAGDGHEAKGSNYVLPHDMSGTRYAQPDWWYCRKCGGIFFAKAEIYSPTQAPSSSFGATSCAAGGRHVAHGWNFVLPHDLASVLKYEPEPKVITLPVERDKQIVVSSHLILRENGTYDFWGEINNPGAFDYTVKVTAYVMDLTKQAYTFAKTTKKVGGSLSSDPTGEAWDEDANGRPNRDLIANWANIAGGSWFDTHYEVKTQFGNVITGIFGVNLLAIIAILV